MKIIHKLEAEENAAKHAAKHASTKKSTVVENQRINTKRDDENVEQKDVEQKEDNYL